MKRFEFQAYAASGRERSGEIEAEDAEEAIARLRERGLTPVMVREAAAAARDGVGRRLDGRGAPE